MMIYMDNCTLQRPLDDMTQPRVKREADAVLRIIGKLESGDIDFISSDVLEFEAGGARDKQKSDHSRYLLRKASHQLPLSVEISERAAELKKLGFQTVDALHLASAEQGKVDYFCTCDDRLTKRAKIVPLRVTVVTPEELAGKIAP